MLKLIQLKYFVTTVEAGNITSATKKLYISQPALSKQLALLEEELNCELFQRKSTGVELTDAGRFLYEQAVILLDKANELSKQMEAFSVKDSLKIGALPSIGSYFLPAILVQMGSKYKVELSIKDSTEELIKLVNNNDLDIAFVQDVQNPKNLTVEHLFNEPYDAIYPKSEFESYKVSIKEFLDNKLVLHKHPCDIRFYFEQFCKSRGLNFSVSIDLESNESIVPFVSNGIGVSIVPRMVSKQLNNDSVVINKLEEEELQRSVDLVYKPVLKSVGKEILKYCTEIIYSQKEKI